MTHKQTGFIEYGSGDPSIILQSSLTSQASVLSPEIGPAGAEKTEASILYDSDLGITYADASNAVVSWADASVFGVMEYAYQISYEIETRFITELSPDATGAVGGSNGITHTAAQVNVALHVLSNAGGSGSFGKVYPFRQAANNSWWFRAQHQNAAGTPSRGITSVGKDKFCTITVSCIGDKIELYINKGLIGTATVANGGNAVERVFAGSDRGNADRGLHSGYHMRNFVISSRPVSLAVIPALRKVVWLGDSFTNQAGTAYGSQLFDARVETEVEREIHNLNIGIGEQSFNSVSGGTWLNSGSTILTELPNAIADDGDVYVLYGGWNDCALNSGGSLDPGTQTSLETVISDIINNTRASAIVIANQTAFQGLATHLGSQYNPNVGRFNTMLATLPAYAETVKAGWGAQVFMSDLFSACGGYDMPATYTKGGLSGANDDQHASAFQSTIVGKAIGQSIITSALK